MIRVTAEASATFARFTIHEVDEKNKKLIFIAQGFTLRDLKRLGISRSSVEGLRITESVDFTTPTAKEVRTSATLWGVKQS